MVRASGNERGEGKQKSDSLRGRSWGSCNLTMGYKVIYKCTSDVTDERGTFSLVPLGFKDVLWSPAAIAIGTVALLSNCG